MHGIGGGGGMPPGGFRLNPNQQQQEEKPLEQFVRRTTTHRFNVRLLIYFQREDRVST